MNKPVDARLAGLSRAVTLSVNGEVVSIACAPSKRLVYALREDLGLTGTKVGCDAGDCGACTVLIDGRQVCACLTPVAQAAGRAIVTVEGLARDGRLNTLQQAFLKHGVCSAASVRPAC